MKKAILNWSGGKDCAISLRKFRQENPDFEIGLLTTISQKTGRVSMHGIRQELIENQAKQLNLKLKKVYLPEMPDNATYEKIMHDTFRKLEKEGVSVSIFGDIFLEDLRRYREKQFANSGINAIFPLWKRDTSKIAREFIHSGFRAIVIAADAQYFSKQSIGSDYDEKFLENLPDDVDPCGENGEFHTFVYDCPGFRKPVKFAKGELVSKEYKSPGGGHDHLLFWFLDLIPD